MRMWKVEPKLLCDKHLRGEHNEMHMFEGSIRKKIDISGYIKDGLIEVHYLQERHDEVAHEMLNRGMNHHSDMDFEVDYICGTVNVQESLKELAFRCPLCRKRILAANAIPAGEIPPSVDYSSVAYAHAKKLNRKLTKEDYIKTLPILEPAR